MECIRGDRPQARTAATARTTTACRSRNWIRRSWRYFTWWAIWSSSTASSPCTPPTTTTTRMFRGGNIVWQQISSTWGGLSTHSLASRTHILWGRSAHCVWGDEPATGRATFHGRRRCSCHSSIRASRSIHACVRKCKCQTTINDLKHTKRSQATDVTHGMHCYAR